MRTICLFLLLITGQWLTAQKCTDDAMAAKTGKWKPGIQGSIHNIAAADLVKEKAFLTGMQKKLSAQHVPVGLDIDYSTSWNKDQSPGYIADPYSLSMYLLRYLCDNSPKGFYVEYSSATNVMVGVNQLFTMDNLYAAPLPADHFRGYLRLFKKPEKKDGAIYMGTELSDNGNIKEENWLITRGDSLPFRFLSRKEYLALTKNKLESKIKAGESYLQQYLDKVKQQLQQPEKELLQPAVCNWSDEERFNGFLKEGERSAFYPVVPDLSYYKKGLPKSAAQFISVKYKYSVGNAVFDKNIQGLKQALSVAYLRSLLGK
jgi:hypothetical protein